MLWRNIGMVVRFVVRTIGFIPFRVSPFRAIFIIRFLVSSRAFKWWVSVQANITIKGNS